MTRRADIRHWAALLLPTTLDPVSGRMDIDRAITLAEALDTRLTERGYGQTSGAGKASTPRIKGHYARLKAPQTALFDRFWTAYALKTGKEEAAGAWSAIDPDPELAERIIAAAATDARGATNGGRTRPDGTSRKYAQGWLSARRWEDESAGTPRPADRSGERPTAPDPAAELRERLALAAALDQQIQRLEHMGLDVPDALREQLTSARAACAKPAGAGR